MKTCCFIGHRKIEITDELIFSIRHILEMLIEEEGVRTFAFGSRSQFNDLCYNIVTDLQKDFQGLEKVCFTSRSEVCCLEGDKEKWERFYLWAFKQQVDVQTFDRKIEYKNKFDAGKADYVERNQAMIDMSDFCVFYFDPNYLPPERKPFARALSSYQPKSGTALAYKYAQQKKKQIFNMFDCTRF